MCEALPAMPSDDPGPEWIISNCSPATLPDSNNQDEFLLSARRVWPYVQAHARRELGSRHDDPENATLAAEVWEGVLRSVALSLHRLRVSFADIANLDSYLVGVFRHRFNRIRRRDQRREQTIQLVASLSELDAIAKQRGMHASFDVERHILARQAIGFMDQWTKRIWIARQYGYSWKDVAVFVGITEGRIKMRFRYKLLKLRGRLGG